MATAAHIAEQQLHAQAEGMDGFASDGAEEQAAAVTPAALAGGTAHGSPVRHGPATHQGSAATLSPSEALLRVGACACTLTVACGYCEYYILLPCSQHCLRSCCMPKSAPLTHVQLVDITVHGSLAPHWMM